MERVVRPGSSFLLFKTGVLTATRGALRLTMASSAVYSVDVPGGLRRYVSVFSKVQITVEVTDRIVGVPVVDKLFVSL